MYILYVLFCFLHSKLICLPQLTAKQVLKKSKVYFKYLSNCRQRLYKTIVSGFSIQENIYLKTLIVIK